MEEEIKDFMEESNEVCSLLRTSLSTLAGAGLTLNGVQGGVNLFVAETIEQVAARGIGNMAPDVFIEAWIKCLRANITLLRSRRQQAEARAEARARPQGPTNNGNSNDEA